MKNIILTVSVILVSSIFDGCPGRGSGTVSVPTPSDFPTTATICSSYSYTFTTPATITSYPSLPGWLSFGSSGISNTISGPPQGNDFGDFIVSGSGAYKGKTGTVTGTINVAPPTLVVTGGPLDITLSGSNTSNSVTLTASPAGCLYVFTLTKTDWQGNQINLPSATLSSSTGTQTLQISVETDVPGTGTVVVRIVPTGTGAQPVTETIPVNAHH